MNLSPDGKFFILPNGKKQRRFQVDGAVLRAFMADRTSRVKIIQGPVGSGTSSACCLHIWQQAMAQPAGPDGLRKFRVSVYRESYPMLEATTVPTWLDWFPEDVYGKFRWSKPFLHEIAIGDLRLEVSFTAMDDIQDARSHFKSLEPSLIWFNEGQFAHLAVVQEAIDRVQPPRFPAVKDGGCAWGGFILDTNAPPADHWIPIMRGDTSPPDWMTEDQRRAMVKPATWTFYMQPPGLVEEFNERGEVSGYKTNPEAENLLFLAPNFYMEKIAGKDKQWIDANIMNRSSVVVDGRPVYPQFRRDVHVATGHLDPIPDIPVVVGIDCSGRDPAALIAQTLRGDWFVQREFIGRDIAMVEFAPQLKNYLAQHYPGFPYVFWGDPAGNQRGSSFDTTPIQVFRSFGMIVRPSPDGQNRQSLRQEAMNAVLLRRSSTGRASALLVDPRCTTFITGMSGGYHMRRIRVSGERYSEEAEKNMYSHICESGEYMMLGGGEGRGVVMSGSKPAAPVNTRRDYNPFARKPQKVVGW